MLFVCLAIASAVGLTVSSSTARAQSVKARKQSNRIVPSPRSVLGFEPGTPRTIADWKQISDYFTRLDEASDRVAVKVLGQTTQNRPLMVAFISAPENLRKLNRYREIQAKLADPRTITSQPELERLVAEGKVIVAISCSIHSTEIVASQMSMQLAYELASATDPATREILQNTILLLIPSMNPDGVDIVANWYRKTLGTKFEGTDPPEIYHHYAGHDNNRDWFMLNLKETRLVTRLFWKEWFPQIVFDVHQQGQTGARFTIPPFYDPTNPNIHPSLIREVGTIGSKMAADLQAANFRGVLTNSQFDTWWHGGFRTSPYYHNSIGILSEAASAKLMTPVTITADQLGKFKTRGLNSALEPSTSHPAPWQGGSWGPSQILAMEMTAARSLLTLAAKYRPHYLRNFYELGRFAASEQTSPEQPVGFVIPAGQGNSEAVARMIEILVEQGVEVHRMTHELHMRMTMSASTTRHGNREMEVPLGSYVVYLAQPQRWNVKALFEPQVYPTRLSATGEAETPYDVAGWTLPMQMGVTVDVVESIREPQTSRGLELVRDATGVRRALALELDRAHVWPRPARDPQARPVRVALYRSWMASMDEGWTRWLFDTFSVPYESVRDADIRKGNLRERYDVIVLASERIKQIAEGNAAGSYPDELTGGMTDRGVENLKRFVEDGGTLVCFDASTEFAIKRFNLPVKNVLEGVARKDFYCPGSIVSIDVDTSIPLARGLNEQTNAYFINSSAFESSDAEHVRAVARYAKEKLLRSGWLLGEKHIAGRIALAEVKLGKGRVILFGFRPQHRGQTWGTFPFIFNAISGDS
jgi:hypothetical protein